MFSPFNIANDKEGFRVASNYPEAFSTYYSPKPLSILLEFLFYSNNCC